MVQRDWSTAESDAWSEARVREVNAWSTDQMRRVLRALAFEVSACADGREHWHESVSVLLAAPELPLPTD